MEQTYLSWDSELFQKKVYKVIISDLNYEEDLNNLRYLDADLFYVFVSEYNPKIHKKVTGLGGVLYDEKITYQKDVQKNSVYVCDPIFEEVHHLTNLLEKLAYQSGALSRFNKDPLLKKQYHKLYYQWINKSVKKEIADKVLLAKVKGEPAGFITLVENNGIGKIGLLGVDADYRGQKIGSKLLGEANDYFYESGIKTIEVVTQIDNIPACSLYEKAGFKRKSIEYIYHYWNR